ncbi:MAG: cysteine desulfurase [Rhodobacteraceae bacterium]|nr:cysteine desulfurase [Paracoccaceae bacterium]
MASKRPHVYLDHNASAPLRAAARDRMVDLLDDAGNASSVHSDGRRARGQIEEARDQVARLCGARTRAVTFTSGATEANATILTPSWQDQGAPVYLDRLLRSSTEHPSVVSGGRFSVACQEVLPVDEQGLLKLDVLETMLASDELTLVSVMAANNETGVIQPIEEIGRIVKAAGAFFHVDAVQAAGRMPIDIQSWQADAISLSAHKFGGPQGMGAIVVGSTARVPGALIGGGGQENWRRAGTENVAGICGFGVAAEEAAVEADPASQAGASRLLALRERLEEGLRRASPATVIFGMDAPRLCNTTCFAVPGVAAETALIAFDLESISVSSGSACSSGKVSVSHVLTAMGVDEALARCALRISLGWNTKEADIDRFLDVWPAIVDRLNPDARTQAA